jgi:hypothetical protein
MRVALVGASSSLHPRKRGVVELESNGTEFMEVAEHAAVWLRPVDLVVVRKERESEREERQEDRETRPTLHGVSLAQANPASQEKSLDFELGVE